ncbi:hypothetical protein [Paenibacillus sp. sptzw28]|nr:hypothetical protein [Paenibacillus sp. sptzw28]
MVQYREEMTEGRNRILHKAAGFTLDDNQEETDCAAAAGSFTF